jgi:hypothetical protein
VGHYTLSSAVGSAQGRVDEPLTWHVTLSGWGNVTAAPDPRWPEMSGWRAFESAAGVESQVIEGRLGGTRTYERLLVPSAGGEAVIPGLDYVYFDPEDAEYRVASTEPIAVSIAPGNGQPASGLPATAGRQPVESVASDIRHLKPVPEHLGAAEQPINRQGIYWVAWSVPLVGAAGYLVWQRRQRYLEDNQGVARSSQARKRAKKALAHARRNDEDTTGKAGQILTAYLSDRLNRPVAGLTHQARRELLAGEGVDGELIERIEVCLVSSELGRFSPEANGPDLGRSLLQEVGKLVDALEKVL